MLNGQGAGVPNSAMLVILDGLAKNFPFLLTAEIFSEYGTMEPAAGMVHMGRGGALHNCIHNPPKLDE
ncbi:hypothetical protein [Chitinophaga barathri]|uniref:Uncharacterized protein n=1 Tax=Chitinophaga barathri TaxID=1647451 RepID=A0A3N4N6C8_9BACT|nr:hypothetical protein [Chitinophaga barathri]RPD43193.1 hypothetical protein EG028_02535 [Chitinophaga barathri]